MTALPTRIEHQTQIFHSQKEVYDILKRRWKEGHFKLWGMNLPKSDVLSCFVFQHSLVQPGTVHLNSCLLFFKNLFGNHK